MKIIVRICRLLVGVLFIFSGFVKADDPLGFTYKLQEYFAKDALNMPWLNGLALPLAIAIPIVEMVLGLMILIGARKKITLWLLLLTILFFSFLTLYTALYNKVTECGCFGDAIPMTAWASFGKNMVLLVLILILFAGRSYINPAFRKGTEGTAILLFTAVSFIFSLYCYNYLPVIDFRPYKVGTDMKQAMKGIPEIDKYYYTYQNKTTGVKKEFETAPDSNGWKYVSYRTVTIKKGIDPVDFNINSLSDENVTDSILNIPGYTLLLISVHLKEWGGGREVMHKINELAQQCRNNNIGFICLTNSGEDEIAAFTKAYNPQFQFFNTDEVVLKTMIRSNPGLILMKNAVIIADWHFHSIPDYNKLKQAYFHTT